MNLVILFMTVEMHRNLEIQRISKFFKQTDLFTTWNNVAETIVQIVTIEIRQIRICLLK